MLLYRIGLRHWNTNQIFFTCRMSAGSAGCVLTAILFNTTVHRYQSPVLKSPPPWDWTSSTTDLRSNPNRVCPPLSPLSMPTAWTQKCTKAKQRAHSACYRKKTLEWDWPGGSVGWTLCRTSMNSCLFYLQEEGGKRWGAVRSHINKVYCNCMGRLECLLTHSYRGDNKQQVTIHCTIHSFIQSHSIR